MDTEYMNGKIYEIVGNGKRYVGSTTQKLSRRLSKHRSNMKAHELGKREWTSSYDILKAPDCKINLLLDYPCKSKEELRRKEGEYILSLDCVNKVVAGRTHDERLEIKRDEYNAKTRETRNRIILKCDSCGKEFKKPNLSRHMKICGDRKVSKTGHKYIYQLTKSGSYTVQLIVDGKRVCKNFEKLEDAIHYRDSFSREEKTEA